MSALKASIKAAKAAFGAKDFDAARAKAEEILEQDPENYFGLVFLGAASIELGKLADAEKALQKAIELKVKDDTSARQGLLRLYDSKEPKEVEKYHELTVELALRFADAGDIDTCHKLVNKYTEFAKRHGTSSQRRRALEIMLPESLLSDPLEGRIPHPSQTYLRVAELLESEEKDFINKEIGERRTRLGAKIDRVTSEVKQEAASIFRLEEAYQDIVNWSNDDDVRRNYEEKLLQRQYDILCVLPMEEKAIKCHQVTKLAEGMVIIKHPFELAWTIVLEWKNTERLAQYDPNVIRDFIERFPDTGLGKLLRGYMQSNICPFPRLQSEEDTKVEGDEIVQNEMQALEERMFLMAEGVEEAKQSILAHRIMGELYLKQEEWADAAATSRQAVVLAENLQKLTGIELDLTLKTVSTSLATSLISYQTPKYHPEARRLFQSILNFDGTSTDALLGLGLIFEEDEDFAGATEFLQKACDRTPDSVRIRAELAWCQAQNGDFQKGLVDLEDVLNEYQNELNNEFRDLKAHILYRIGFCKWHIDTSDSARKDRNGAYSHFIAALKANPSYAPAYTSIGMYFADYRKDKKRARKSFEKAFDLSSSEIEAAERLARTFADEGDWELVEAVAKKVVESGKARAPPGSKKKSYSWPFAALGVVALNGQQYAKSIINFNAAVRINPMDYNSFVGLGESYHNSGRFIAATKAFQHAQSLEEGLDTKTKEQVWFTEYMLANVKRELGAYENAIEIYDSVLAARPTEYGVQTALLQTLTEGACNQIELGMYGAAATNAARAIQLAKTIAAVRPDSFNLWKSVGDACSVFSWTKKHTSKLNMGTVKELLQHGSTSDTFEIFSDKDKVTAKTLSSLADDELADEKSFRYLYASILAYKRAITASSNDTHCQAVAWYNLGWAEHRAFLNAEIMTKKYEVERQKRFLRASYLCFKRAIELEAGNADFWNALGIATSTLNAKVAQHSFVRSININEKNASVWANLGTLYLIHGDHENANQAFTRAQSADPDYAYAWLGQGMIALLIGVAGEARSLFKHAYEISSAAEPLPRRQFAMSLFDELLKGESPVGTEGMLQLLFALDQLRMQSVPGVPAAHLHGLYLERVRDFDRAQPAFKEILHTLEAIYEKGEESTVLAKIIQAKSDLARVQLSKADFTNAIENAETAVDLSDVAETKDFPDESRKKVSLSSNITLGLAYHKIGDYDKSMESFAAALEISGRSVEVLCLVSKILWARGGKAERQTARDQLMESVEKDPNSPEAVILLGAIALIDSDQDVIEAVEADLKAMRRRDDLKPHERKKLAELFALMSELGLVGDQELSIEERQQEEARRLILTRPALPDGWTQLAHASTDFYPADMALDLTRKSLPPHGNAPAEDLAEAYALTERRGDALRAIMAAPWSRSGWKSLELVVGEQAFEGLPVSGYI